MEKGKLFWGLWAFIFHTEYVWNNSLRAKLICREALKVQVNAPRKKVKLILSAPLVSQPVSQHHLLKTECVQGTSFGNIKIYVVVLFLISKQLITIKITEKLLRWKPGSDIYTKLVAILLASVHKTRGITGITHTQILVVNWRKLNHEIANDASHQKRFPVLWNDVWCSVVWSYMWQYRYDCKLEERCMRDKGR